MSVEASCRPEPGEPLAGAYFIDRVAGNADWIKFWDRLDPETAAEIRRHLYAELPEDRR